MSWPGENGVPPNAVAMCPNFPDCGCDDSCHEDVPPRPPDGALVILAVGAAVFIATAATAWLLLKGMP